MDAGIDRFIRPPLLAIGGLDSKPRQVAGQRLMSNENPYGCSPRVWQALANYRELNLYPDPEQGELKELLSEYTGVGTEYILASNGCEDLIDQVIRLFVGPGDEVISCTPTFGLFQIRTEMYGGTFIDVPRGEDFATDVAAVKAGITNRTRLICLVNPNNPTGTLIPQRDILEIVDMGLPTVVDEAYFEFCGETMCQFIRQYENMMVLRTFSKWAGLAGLRIGYGIFQPKIVAYLRRIKGYFNVNAIATIAVRESLKDRGYLQDNIEKIIAERERLFTELGKLKFLKPFPSQGNFIFCSVLDGKASEIQSTLEKEGIRINILREVNALRITAGKPEQTDAVMKALRKWERIRK